ncbi:MAG: YwiC-like family protein [Blastocatellales bacterium]
MSLRSTLKLPKEHGAWAMLYVPFVLGVAVAGRVNWPVLLLLLSTTAMFISRESLLAWSRARARGRDASEPGKMLLIYLALAAAFGLPLILAFKLYWLAPLGLIGCVLLLINAKQGERLEERSLSSEVMAICGLTLTAPAAYYAASGRWDGAAFWLWLLSAFYFASSVFYIKLRIYRLNPRKQAEQRQAWRSCAVYHSFMIVALAALTFAGGLSLFALIAFAPVLARTFWGMFKPKTKVNLTRAGILEIAYSLVFLVCVALGFRAA